MLRPIVLTALLMIGTAPAGSARQTTAFMMSTLASDTSQFSAGTISLSATASPSTLLTLSPTYPGAPPAYGSVTVQNTGTNDLRYSITSFVESGSAALANAVELTVRTKTANPCTSEDGTTLYGPSALAATSGERQLVGDTAKGQQSGDRTLGPSASEPLCFRVALPTTAPSNVQGLDAVVSLTFHAEQVAGT